MLTNFRCFLPDMFNILDYFFNTHTIFLDMTIQLLKMKLTKCISIEDSFVNTFDEKHDFYKHNTRKTKNFKY